MIPVSPDIKALEKTALTSTNVMNQRMIAMKMLYAKIMMVVTYVNVMTDSKVMVKYAQVS